MNRRPVRVTGRFYFCWWGPVPTSRSPGSAADGCSLFTVGSVLPWVVLPLISIVGILVARSGLAEYRRLRRCEREWVPVPGRVVDREKVVTRGTGQTGSGQSRSTVYFPIVEYETTDGVVHTRKSRYGGNFRTAVVGEPVDVIYDPKSPDDFLVVGRDFYLLARAKLAMGALAAIMGVFGIALAMQ